jgi:L-aminopeptidase/D-esterase-like protein
LGLKVGILPTGPLDAITDVAGVEVGHTTIIRGTDVRTGVTAILPHPGNLFRERVPGAVPSAINSAVLTKFARLEPRRKIKVAAICCLASQQS